MYPHHEETLRKVTGRFKDREGVLALLLGGSVAHGFERADSDLDIMIVVSEEEYAERRERGELVYFDREDATYDSGYVDGKYITKSFLERVAATGSEPARFAFKDSRIIFSSLDGLSPLLDSIARYPLESKRERIRRFYAQLEAWKWYCGEALKHDNAYLLGRAVSNLVLFGGRMILAHNETLYPYHKWFLTVLDGVAVKPAGLRTQIDALIDSPSPESIEAFHRSILEFTDWKTDGIVWPNLFMLDSELTWMEDKVPVADL